MLASFLGILYWLFQTYRDTPFSVWVMMAIFGVSFIFTLALYSYQKLNKPKKESSNDIATNDTLPKKTFIRLQYKVAIAPLEIGEENIWRWYSLSFALTPKLDKRKKQPVKTTVLFTFVILVFDKPIPIKQLDIDGGGIALPPYEIKDSSQRHAIISFGGELEKILS